MDVLATKASYLTPPIEIGVRPAGPVRDSAAAYIKTIDLLVAHFG